MWGLSPSVRGNRARMMYRDQYERCIPTRARSPVAVRQLMCLAGSIPVQAGASVGNGNSLDLVVAKPQWSEGLNK